MTLPQKAGFGQTGNLASLWGFQQEYVHTDTYQTSRIPWFKIKASLDHYFNVVMMLDGLVVGMSDHY